MPTFASRSLSPSPLSSHLRRHPFLLFGLPFISLVIASSFALQTFTRIRYDLHDQKVTTLTKEEELGMSHKRKKVDLRDEYYKLTGMGGPTSDLALNADSTLQSDLAGTSTTPNRSKRKPFSMAPVDREELENIRVPRPPGVPEWGVMRSGEGAPVVGQRKEDRWV